MEAAFLALPYDLDTTALVVRQSLAAHALAAALSFHIDQACATFSNPACPHGGRLCDCRLATLWVSAAGRPALSLVLHQHAGATELWLDPESAAAEPELAGRVQTVLTAVFQQSVSRNRFAGRLTGAGKSAG